MEPHEKRKRVSLSFTGIQKRLKIEDDQNQSVGTQGVPYFYKENGPNLTFPEEASDYYESVLRINEAYDSASDKPFAKENLRKATNWLHFQGLVVSELVSGNKPTLAQQIVQYLKNEADHGFRLCTSDGNIIIPKGILLLVSIAHLHPIRIVIFSTRKKPIEIPSISKECYTIALLRHQDSILSEGAWYALEQAKNWVKQTATIHMDTVTSIVSSPAIKRLQGAAPKRKVPADYASISDDTLRNLLRLVMKERLQNDFEKKVKPKSAPKKLENFKEKNIKRTRPPKGYLESILNRLSETIDTSNMDTLGLSSRLGRIKEPNTMQIWKEVVEEYMTAISMNTTTPSRDSSSRMILTEQDDEDDEEDMSDNHRIVTTTLRQIIRNELSLTDIEQQLVSEQKFNHQIFESFYNIIQEATNMVVSGKISSFMNNPNVRCLDLTEVFPQDYNFGEHMSKVIIAPIPENVSALIDAGFFSFSHFENLFYGCVGNIVRKESKFFAQIRNEINSKKEVPSTIAGATSHHAIRQASLKEVYTSITNMWKGDIYSKSLRNVIRALLRVHLAPIRMTRYKEIKQRKAKAKQMKQEQGKWQRNQKRKTLRLMNELGVAVINNRPTFVVQKIAEKLQESLDTPIGNQDKEIQNESELGELDELDIAIYTASEDDDVEDVEEEEVTESEVIQETSAKTIRALLSIMRMLIESGKIHRVVTSDDIQHAAFKGTTFTEKEKLVAAKIVNFIRPFVQQRTDDNKFPEPHILTRAPLAALANVIATITGFPSLVRKLSITSKDIRALHLTAAGVYDAFHEQYDIPVDDTNWITNSNQAGKNKPAIFKAFFNTNKIQSLMDSHGLQFDWKVIFINKWAVRLLGKAKPGKAFIKSNFEARKKEKDKTTKQTLMTPTLDRSSMESLAETHTKEVKDLTKILTPLRKEISRLELQRMEIGRKVRRSQWDPGSDNYNELKKIRQEISIKRLKLIKLEKDLSTARSLLHSLNKALNFASTTRTIASKSANSAKKKLLNEVEKEDYIEKMDLLPEITKHFSSQQKVVFSGTDPGTVITSITTPRSLETIFADINRFNILASYEDSSEDDEDNPDLKLYNFNVERLPKPYKITAGLINEVTFSKKHQKKREQRQKQGIDKEVQQKKQAKENREREIRTKRVYGKICAQERRHIRAHIQLPSNSPKPTLIQCIGHWQGINSRIKGHSKRGMKKIRAQHRNYGNVAIVNEFNTSKICPYCFSKLVLHRARRNINGKERTVRLHGAVECVHPRCPARKLNYTTRGRDANASANIALSGASIVLAADCRPLPPFRRNSSNQTRYNLVKELSLVATPGLVPRDFIRDE